jgi:hypothetical protein
MKKLITNRAGTVTLPWEPGLEAWLQAQYPHSGYYTVEVDYV